MSRCQFSQENRPYWGKELRIMSRNEKPTDERDEETPVIVQSIAPTHTTFQKDKVRRNSAGNGNSTVDNSNV